MSNRSSTLYTVGTLLRHAQDSGAAVRVLVEGCWLDGRIVAADQHGVVLEEGPGRQVLVRLDTIVAVGFSREEIDAEQGSDEQEVRAHGRRVREPIEAGPAPSR
ncbi:hypothetical protein L2K70_07865 [Nocardioides KLBMP 9356]|uniref:RNA-binding protein n=1 Tax=Nocardioides potassii TaxID=2911371 RepID=A0ABS9HAP7_9ACTN|nr:hypothetical protein [Nocardioides potassii]MCF6377519.1 hypothetical protein [Nocardioides potassii]